MMDMRKTDFHECFAIGVDVGGTKINTGVINREGEVKFFYSLPTLAQESVVERITQGIERLFALIRDKNEKIILKGIGVGTAGQVDWGMGSIRFASDLLPGYTGTPLKQYLEDKFGLTTYIDNDVNVLAMLEKHLGAGQGVKHMICLALGTGVGGAIMINGKIVHGAWGGAGEIGHMSVQFKGLPCICGNVGCLEQYASGTGIAKLMNVRLATHKSGIATKPLNAKEVMALWLEGDNVATEVMEEVISALGSAITSLIHIFNPELIVIGGGVAEAGDFFFSRLKQAVRQRVMPSMYSKVRIEPAYQGNLSGMIGASLQVWEYVATQGANHENI
jgi:glucokinase